MQGIIVENVSNKYNVEVNNVIYVCNARGKFKNNEIVPVVGDLVDISIIDKEKKEGMIEKIMPRKNHIKRPKLSNISQVILVLSSRMPNPDLLMLDKQLAYLEYLNIPAIIVINKIDLDKSETVRNIQDIYAKIGYMVILTNAKEGYGISQLQDVINGKITVFSGNSGVGKSTLLNKILKKEMTQEGKISIKNQKGKNTTTAVSLYKIDGNTYIADTPGFGTFDTYEIDLEKIDKYFVEFNKHIKDCKYVGCSHIKEEDCGIKRAIEKGEISIDRYNRYVKIYNDKKDKEEHKW